MSKQFKATVTHDGFADAWYVLIRRRRKVRKTIEEKCTVNFDVDEEGQVIGIEILEAE